MSAHTPAAHSAIAKINLAPEVYQNSQRDKRNRHLATTLGIIVSAAALVIVAIAGIVLGGQTVAITLLKQSIASDQAKIQNYPELVKAVTAQEHLASWQQLNQQKVFLSRFFTVLQQVAPQGIALSNVTIDQSNNLQVTATASGYQLATKFVQALQASNTQIGTNASSTQQPYFTNVQLAAVSSTQAGQVGFQLTTQMSSQVTSNGK